MNVKIYKQSLLGELMGIVALILKVMPSSPDANLGKIKTEAKEVLSKLGGKNISFEERPIAFGLKAVMVKMAWPEEKDTDIAVDALKEINEVSEIDVEDYRRAFG